MFGEVRDEDSNDENEGEEAHVETTLQATNVIQNYA